MKESSLFLKVIILFIFLFLFSTPSLAFIPGDFGSTEGPTPDGVVDFEDLMIFALAYGSTEGDANWNPDCDIYPDGIIDFEDLMIFALHYGEGSSTTEIELIEVASKEINLNEGGIIEITDLENELFGLKLIIEPITEQEKGLVDEIINIVMYIGLTSTCVLPEYQGYLITPIVIQAGIEDMIPGKSRIEIPYNEKQLINSGVSKDSEIHVLRTIDINQPWEELSPDHYIIKDNVVTIPIGWTVNYPGFYFYTLTVDNAIPPDPNDFKNPLPGDLLYKFSKLIPFKINEGWLPGHVGIYVGERYDEENEKKYNVIEALLSGVQYRYYENISEFKGDSIYLGAREPEYGLSHEQRNLILALAKAAIGSEYAAFETFTSMIYSGLGMGKIVKGPNRYNCVGLAEAAYQYAGIDLVSDYDEGNQEWSAHDILTPAEQWYNTVPATGVIDQNISPEISGFEMVPGNPVGIGSQVIITCNATDQDQDILTYEWSVPNETDPIIRGKQLDLQVPSVADDYEITCRVFDNYGGEDTKSITINVGSSGPVHNITKNSYYNTIQAAFDDADNNNTIEVADGTYNELITFPQDKAITLQSINGSDHTIIDGSGLGDSVVTIGYALEGTNIEGLTITGGNADDYGGGINLSESHLTLTNCTITNNSATIHGGAIDSSESHLTLTNCTITNNSATNHGGGISTFHGILTLTNCTITNNSSSFGGGIEVYCGTFEMTNCTITNNSANQGGGINTFQSLSTLTNCTITNNSADWGGGIYSDDKPTMFSSGLTITDCTINENSAVNRGGGIYLYKPAYEIQIIGNQIRYNSGAYSGGGIYIYEPSVIPTIAGNILCGNICDNVASADNQIYPNNYPDNDISATCNDTYVLRDIGPAGGWIFYDKGSYSDGWRYLEAAPASAELTLVAWGIYWVWIRVTETGIGTGQSNTTAIVGIQGTESDYAAPLCDALVVENNGVTYSDWFLPSKDELNLMYTNLKVFGVGGFADSYYWSSFEFDRRFAWFQSFDSGNQYAENKSPNRSAWAVRAF